MSSRCRRHLAGTPPSIDEEVERRNARVRRRTSTPSALLGWCLLAALLVQLVLLPTAYFLMRDNGTTPPPEPFEVAYVETPPAKEPPAPKRRRPKKNKVPKADKPKLVARKKPKPKPKAAQPKAAQPKPKKATPPRLKKQRLKMVELNTPETEQAPDNARFLSDKNRRVERETRARFTNLVHDAIRPKPPQESKPKPNPGSDKPKIAENRRVLAQSKRVGQKARKPTPLMSMRSPAPPPPRESKIRAPRAPGGTLSANPPSLAKRAMPLSKQRLNHRSYDRIFGKLARAERKAGRISPSKPRGGRTNQKWQRVRAALENFVPEVRPGNQTALGTRAHPFALYVARMHRTIHKHWAFGFLADLDKKPDGHDFNNFDLWTMIEIAVQPDGQVAKATIVRPSGMLAFDAVAIDTVYTSGPYPPSPRAIRSGDGNVYLHWRFHRNHRQCGTFGVDTYIVATPPEGPIDTAAEEVGTSSRRPRRLKRLNSPGAITPGATGWPTHAPHHHGPHAGHPHPEHGPSAPAAAPPVSPKSAPVNASANSQDRADAQQTLQRFLDAFARGDANAMAQACAVPFHSAGAKVAHTRAELRKLFQNLLAEETHRATAVGPMMSAMQARKQLGQLPRGLRYGQASLVAQARLGHATVYLLLDKQGDSWHLTGLNR